MATRAEKSYRRWEVIQGLLIALGAYVIVLLGFFYIEKDIGVLDNITTLMFGLVGVLGIGNWMTAPAEDD